MLIPMVSSLTVVYPKVVPTVVFIPTLVYILTVVCSLSVYSPQHSPHSYFHVIIISYPAVRVKFYAYVNMPEMRLTYYLLEANGIKMFRFPIDPERRKAWVDAIKRVGWQPKAHSRVCSAHFISG